MGTMRIITGKRQVKISSSSAMSPMIKPQVEAAEAEGRAVLRVTLPDYVLGKKLEIDADIMRFGCRRYSLRRTKEVAIIQGNLKPDGFFKEAHAKLRPVEFAADGVYLCGIAHYPKLIKETVSQAYGAAGRVLTLLSHDTVTASGAVCEVDESKCVSCGACIAACTYGAMEFYETEPGQESLG
jgi:heterodisulfide reductase subunit A2